jgi:hypothetical protein
MRALFVVALLVAAASADDKAGKPLEMFDEAKGLMVVGACAKGEVKVKSPDIVAAHCKKVTASQDDYKKSWITPAAAFFKTNVPSNIPKTIVYPFAGGDLASALAVFPDADEITTLGLEPAGDPKALGNLDEAGLKKALDTVEKELTDLYRASFSKTMSMINTMRGGKLPTQLVLGLSAFHMMGYELVGMRYFKLDNAGDIVYLTESDVSRISAIKDLGARNTGFGNVEIRFRKVGSKREQIYRHIMANLDNKHLTAAPGPIKHLAKKGKVTAMTKAASYLLSYGDFSMMRNYILDHVEWMVSDTTGVPPPYGEPLGFEYETWGDWKGANFPAGNGAVRIPWKKLYETHPHKPLSFRFGYPNNVGEGHLVFMKRGPKAKPAKDK